MSYYLCARAHALQVLGVRAAVGAATGGASGGAPASPRTAAAATPTAAPLGPPLPPADEAAMQLLHSYALQRRLRGVDDALRTGAAAALAVVEQEATEAEAAAAAAAKVAEAATVNKPTQRLTRGMIAAKEQAEAATKKGRGSERPSTGQVVWHEVSASTGMGIGGVREAESGS